ncbi:MAG: ABC transporter ATP-binding protein, partial [Clostridia bacterium]|nr:ABC transporter ATP-binding protein [Clostridia bacterium]
VAFLHKGKLLLWEEKDRLAERYGVIQCMEEEIADYGEAVKGRRITPYGAQILVDRSMLPDLAEVMPVGVEDLFVYLVKEERR